MLVSGLGVKAKLCGLGNPLFPTGGTECHRASKSVPQGSSRPIIFACSDSFPARCTI